MGKGIALNSTADGLNPMLLNEQKHMIGNNITSQTGLHGLVQYPGSIFFLFAAA